MTDIWQNKTIYTIKEPQRVNVCCQICISKIKLGQSSQIKQTSNVDQSQVLTTNKVRVFSYINDLHLFIYLTTQLSHIY